MSDVKVTYCKLFRRLKDSGKSLGDYAYLIDFLHTLISHHGDEHDDSGISLDLGKYSQDEDCEEKEEKEEEEETEEEEDNDD